MATHQPSLREIAIKALTSTECPHCGSPKDEKKSLCYRCFKALPYKLKQALYSTFSDGYAEKFDEALTYLKAETDIPPKPAEKKPECGRTLPGMGKCRQDAGHKSPCLFEQDFV